MSWKRKKKNHSSLFLVFRNSHEKRKKKKSELISLVIRNVVDWLTTHPQPLEPQLLICHALHVQRHTFELVLTKQNKELGY